jgi:hypothetical protein
MDHSRSSADTWTQATKQAAGADKVETFRS